MVTLEIPAAMLARIHTHGEASYPEEGAGLLLGTVDGDSRRVLDVLILPNTWEESARRSRYEFSPQDLLYAHEEAERRELEVVGVFHSHPDHPGTPSEFDRERALPWLSYVVISVRRGCAVDSRAWRLTGDGSCFEEERLAALDGALS